MRKNPACNWATYFIKLINNNNATGNIIVVCLLILFCSKKVPVIICIAESRTTGFSPHEVFFGRKSSLFLIDRNDDFRSTCFLIKNVILCIYIHSRLHFGRRSNKSRSRSFCEEDAYHLAESSCQTSQVP